MTKRKKAEEKPQPVVAIDKSEFLAHSDSPIAAPGVRVVVNDSLPLDRHTNLMSLDAVACPTCGTSREMMAPHEPCAVCGQQLEDRP